MRDLGEQLDKLPTFIRYYLSILMLSSNLVLEMATTVDVHHAPARTVANAEAYTMSPLVSPPVSASIPSLSRQLGTASSSTPECSSTVSSHLALANCRD